VHFEMLDSVYRHCLADALEQHSMVVEDNLLDFDYYSYHLFDNKYLENLE
jgi:hypothetical protein